MKYLSGCHILSFPPKIGTSEKRSGSLTRGEYESAFDCDRGAGGYDSSRYPVQVHFDFIYFVS
jgi:hypothetical protein